MSAAAIDALLMEIKTIKDNIYVWNDDMEHTQMRIDEAEEQIIGLEKAIEVLREMEGACDE
jgi:predicted  nucleic acid-binding Zn-ribbon protein